MSLLADDTRLSRRVGAVALFVLAGAIAFFVFVFDRIEWGGHVRVRVFFHTSGGLREGAPFVVAGRSVGRIETIGLSPRGAPGPLGGEEGVVATVAIDASDAAALSKGGDIFVASRGPLSDRYLELGPAPEPGTRFREDEPLLGRDPPSLDRVVQRTWDNLTTAARFMAEVRPEFEALRVEIRTLAGTLQTFLPDLPGVASLMFDLAALREEAKHTWEIGLGGRAGVERAARLVDHARRVGASFRTTLDALGKRTEALQAAATAAQGRLGTGAATVLAKLDVAIERVQLVIAKVDPLLAQVDAINERFARGEGSIGKLMHDPEFPEDAKELGKIMKRQPWRIIARPHD